jgi:hypothetical protein
MYICMCMCKYIYEVVLQIWDIGGQSTGMYIKSMCVYMYVYVYVYMYVFTYVYTYIYT